MKAQNYPRIMSITKTITEGGTEYKPFSFLRDDQKQILKLIPV